MNTSFWKDRRVFVTGCDGFIGSWLTAGLVSAGADVVGLLRDQVPRSQLVRSGTIDRITIVTGDLTDYPLLERTLAEYEIDTVFHLAAQTIVQIANRAPLSTFETNIKGTWVLMEAARRNPTVKRVIVASSDKAYGTQVRLPYTEDSPLQGRHPYDVSKSCADLIAQAYANTYEMPIVVTRFANLYGGGDLNWSRIVPGTIRSALQGNKPVIRSDGTFRRDYLFVGDAVSAYMLLAERMQAPEVSGQVFNFGLDQPIEANMMVRIIIDLAGRPDLEPIILNQAQNEIPDQYLSSKKAHRILGWKPQHNIEEGLLKTIDWYRNFLTG
ncbi:MAG: GDP-mannose 4,6-dehydratase [Candidatus Promineifilaceae bacterium]